MAPPFWWWGGRNNHDAGRVHVSTPVAQIYWETGQPLPWCDARLPVGWHLNWRRVPVPPQDYYGPPVEAESEGEEESDGEDGEVEDGEHGEIEDDEHAEVEDDEHGEVEDGEVEDAAMQVDDAAWQEPWSPWEDRVHGQAHAPPPAWPQEPPAPATPPAQPAPPIFPSDDEEDE